MLFSIVVALMVILITAFWAYQGFFSSLIMFFSAVVACMLAFGFYESLNSVWADSLNSMVGLPLAFMLIFLISLAILRFATDKFIAGNVRLPVYLDRAGAGVVGFFSGLIIVGMALVAIQMLPIGPAVFGFDRVQSAPNGTIQTKGFFFKPDSFTVGLASMLSSGRFGGETPLEQAKPDMLLDLYSARANPQPSERMFLPEDCLTVSAYWEASQIDEVTQRVDGESLVREFSSREPSSPGNKLIVCRVRVDASAAKEAAEIRFRPAQFRLVGPPPAADGSRSAEPEIRLACGLSDIYTHKDHGLKSIDAAQATRLVRFGPQTDLILGPNQTPAIGDKQGKDGLDFISGYKFDVAFEVPATFVPWYIEFKRGPRVELTKKMFKDEPPAYASIAGGRDVPSAEKKASKKKRDDEKSDASGGGDVDVGDAPGGATHVANAIAARTGVFSTIPFPLDGNDNVVRSAVRGGKLGDCHFNVEIPDPPPSDWDVKEFDVPGGKKMVQLGADKNDALSMFGKALNYATNVAAQIYIADDAGNNYYAIGVYSAAPIGGKMVLEVQYHPEADVPERCLAKAQKVTANIMRDTPEDQRKFGYLFLVDPGVTLVSFSSGARQNLKQVFKKPIVVPD